MTQRQEAVVLEILINYKSDHQCSRLAEKNRIVNFSFLLVHKNTGGEEKFGNFRVVLCLH